MSVSLMDLIMKCAPKYRFTKEDWTALGENRIEDEGQIKAMLAEGYDWMEEES